MTKSVIWDSLESTRKAIANQEIYPTPMNLKHQQTLNPAKPEHRATLLALSDEERQALVPTECNDLRLSAWRIVQCMHAIARDLLDAGNFKEALKLYDAATLAPGHEDPWLYANALYAVQAGNHHLGPMRERANRYLERCLPYGSRLAAIFFNASCVLVELGEPERAIDCVRDAVRYGYEKLDLIKDDATLAPLRADPRFLAVFEDSELLAEAEERTLPPALVALRALNGDWGEIDFEMYPAMERPEETFEWMKPWTNNKEPPAARLRVFAQDGTGGKVAFWRQDTQRPLDEEPVVFLGSEGELGVVAQNLADFLVLFSGGIGPMETVEHGVQELTEDLASLPKVKAIVKKHYPGAVGRTVAAVLADAKKVAPDFVVTVQKSCK